MEIIDITSNKDLVDFTDLEIGDFFLYKAYPPDIQPQIMQKLSGYEYNLPFSKSRITFITDRHYPKIRKIELTKIEFR